ncbi:glycosyl transferase [Linderina pennispora]|uniref:Glycosyl transferase n=1 Tax=Linderina pennispora TaxID=61395 RepID=A0A1Y1WB49_9FUNG|nr:glycosyl transferase [Linderina pennispora]ORX70753.1 glycosyl transferase [Linderina pennispora]
MQTVLVASLKGSICLLFLVSINGSISPLLDYRLGPGPPERHLAQQESTGDGSQDEKWNGNAPLNEDGTGLKHPLPGNGPATTVTERIVETVVAREDDAGIEEKVSAAFVILTRNRDLKDLRETLIQLEDRINRKYHYPYVFLNNEPFSDEFKEKISKFGLIPKEHWSYPEWINQTKAAESGFFFRHPLMDKYKWYWRVEPGVKFACDVDYDPFLFMEKNNKKYGFTISLKEYEATVPTLWKTTMAYMDKRKDLIPETNLMEFVTKDDGKYNLCHFWSNFEIASLDFLRSEEYLSYFDYLDKEGGFFYERWGDAPVHSLAVAMFLNKNQVHWFEDIGYYHGPLWNCPKGKANDNLLSPARRKANGAR